MTSQRTITATEDPVCGMTVDQDEARPKGLTLSHEGTEYAFCGKGCLLEFRDDPARYLDPAYTPSMWSHGAEPEPAGVAGLGSKPLLANDTAGQGSFARSLVGC